MIYKNRRGQTESGPLQKIFIAVILVSLAAFASLNMINDLNINYGPNVTTGNFSQYSDEFDQIQDASEDLGDSLSDLEQGNIITVAITGGYQTLVQFITLIPDILNSMFTSVLSTMGLGAYVPYIHLILFTVILFAIIALIMKVRG